MWSGLAHRIRLHEQGFQVADNRRKVGRRVRKIGAAGLQLTLLNEPPSEATWLGWTDAGHAAARRVRP